MNNSNIPFNLDNITFMTYIFKTFFISLSTYYTFLKIINIKKFFNAKLVVVFIFSALISILCGILKYKSTSFTSIVSLFLILSALYSIITKNNIGFSMLITVIALSINYVSFFISIIINFIPNIIFIIKNDFINLALMIFFHYIIIYHLFKIKKLKNGFTFLKFNSKNEYFDILILDISVVVLFSFIILNNFNLSLTLSLIFGLIAFSILMFITIQKTFTMYYKHKLLVSELEETKAELENKNKEIEKLEDENLNFSKVSHSIAHKQKSLEHKLNQLMLNTEISSELDISNKVKELSKQCFSNTTTIELPKTDIEQIDDMLSFMQDECTKNNIDFEIKLNGNIYHMVNNFIDKNGL